MTPRQIGRYRIGRLLGQGGFAHVYLAYDEALESDVAVKLLGEEWSFDVDTRERFLQEARLLRRVRSPHLVPVYDVGQLDDSRPYFVMAVADRGTLAERLEERSASVQPAPGDIVQLAAALADGLGALHNAGVVHRDVNPRNLLLVSNDTTDSTQPNRATAVLGADEQVVLADLGLAKDLRLPGDPITIVGGTPRYRAPEQLAPTAAIGPATDCYGATAVIWEVLSGTPPPALHELDRRLTDVSPEWRGLFERGFAPDPEDRFADIGEWREAILELIEADISMLDQTAPAVERCPYLGLASYRPDDADLFYGREALLDRLIERLRFDRALTVGGPSGSGKSSLVGAGLLPALAGGALPASTGWEVVRITPGADPLGTLQQALATAVSDAAGEKRGDGETGPPLTVAELSADPQGVIDAMATAAPILVVIDQMEELFTHGAPAEQQRKFVAVLEALARAEQPHRVVCLLRSDFYTPCASFDWLAAQVTRHVFVGQMARAELRRAIEAPALRLGYTIERELVDAILDEVGDEPGILPHLSQALATTWEHRDGRQLTVDGYRESGGVTGALEQHAESWWGSLDPGDQGAARSTLLRLVSPGTEHSPDTRRLLPIDDAGPVARPMLESLAGARLVTIEEGTARLAHETLLVAWPRLAGWLDDERVGLRLHAELTRDATAWGSDGRPVERLYQGARLEAAREWADPRPDRLSEVEAAFLQQSTLRATRARRIRRAVGATLLVLAIAATVAAVFANRASNRAEEATRLATSRRLAAESTTTLANNDRPLASLLALAGVELEPTREARSALLTSLATGVDDALVLRGHEGDVRAAAATPSGDIVVSAGLDGTVRAWPTAGGDPVVMVGHEGEVRDVAAVDDETAISVGIDGTVRLWDLPTGAERTSWTVTAPAPPEEDGGGGSGGGGNGGGGDGGGGSGEGSGGGGDGGGGSGEGSGGGGDGGGSSGDGGGGSGEGSGGGGSGSGSEAPVRLRAVAVSPDGSTALVAGEGGVWQVALPEGSIDLLVATETEARDVAWRPGGTEWVVALRDGTIQRHDAAGDLLDTVDGHDDVALAVAWHPEGESFASVARDGSLKIWPVDGVPRSLPDAHAAEVFGVSYAPDGSTIATAGADRAIRIWTLDDLVLARELLGHTSDVRDVVHIGDGARLGSVGNDATVRVWGDAGAAGRVELAGPDDGVLAFALDRDHQVLAGADRAGGVHVWDPETGELLHSAQLHDTPATGIDIAAGQVVSVSSASTVSQWTPDSDTERQISLDGGSPRSVALTPDAATIVVGMQSGEILVVDAESGEIVSRLAGHDDEVFDLAIHPDATTIVSVGRDGTARVWDLDAAVERETIVTAGSELRTVAFSPNGDLVAIGGAGGSIREFRSDGWELRRTHSGHETDVRDLAYSIDGALLASVGRDRTVRLWDTTTGDELAAVSPHSTDIRAAVIVGAGDRLVSAANDGEVVGYAGPATWDAAVCDLAGRDLTDDEWLDFGGPDVDPVPLCAVAN